jgi:hypothetical protein
MMMILAAGADVSTAMVELAKVLLAVALVPVTIEVLAKVWDYIEDVARDEYER